MLRTDTPSVHIHDVTGLILAGGASSRMRNENHGQNVDKGLLLYHGKPLVQHMLERLRPQVKTIAISANRHLEQYQAFNVPIWPDQKETSWETFPGPLAGMLTGLRRCRTAWLATVPCDAPLVPLNLVKRLHEQAVAKNAKIAFASTHATEKMPQNVDTEQKNVKDHPVFALLHHSLADSLYSYLQKGDRKILLWIKQHAYERVLFDEQAPFTANINTAADLETLSEQPLTIEKYDEHHKRTHS